MTDKESGKLFNNRDHQIIFICLFLQTFSPPFILLNNKTIGR